MLNNRLEHTQEYEQFFYIDIFKYFNDVLNRLEIEQRLVYEDTKNATEEFYEFWTHVASEIKNFAVDTNEWSLYEQAMEILPPITCFILILENLVCREENDN